MQQIGKISEHVDVAAYLSQPKPEIPSWFNQKLLEIAGRAPNGLPMLRVVWGQDPEDGRMFGAGTWHYKYMAARVREQKITGYEYRNLATGKTAKIDIATARRKFQDKFGEWKFGKNDLLVPISTEEVKEFGMPLWFIERWEKPENVWGSREEYERERWESNTAPSDEGVPIISQLDMFGPWPENGVYVRFLDVQQCNEKGHFVFKPLREDVIEEVRELWTAFLAEQRKSYEQRVIEAEAKADKRREEEFEELKEAIISDITPSLPRLMGNPSIIAPDTSHIFDSSNQ